MQERFLLGPVLLATALGAFAGIGGFTFSYAKGFSYFKREPEACANCHIMQPQFASWQRAGHHHTAVCADCHLPATFLEGYWVKAENGYRHSKLFTTQNFHEPIRLGEAAARILQDNCVRCHAALVDSTSIAANSAHAGAPSCVHCHADAGHGEPSGLGGPRRPHEFDLLETDVKGSKDE